VDVLLMAALRPKATSSALLARDFLPQKWCFLPNKQPINSIKINITAFLAKIGGKLPAVFTPQFPLYWTTSGGSPGLQRNARDTDPPPYVPWLFV